MAQKYSIQYVNFYTDGSAARKLSPALRVQKATLPKPKKHKRRVIYLDPVAVLGMAVAVCMLVMMFVGLATLFTEQRQTQAMESYVNRLQAQQEQLSTQYQDGYDLEEVERTALALGMVPQSQVRQTAIHVPLPEPQTEQPVSLWDRFGTFLSGLFA